MCIQTVTTIICCVENDKPTFKYILIYVEPYYCDDWKDIGIELDLNSAMLKVIEDDHCNNRSASFHAMIKKWMLTNVNVTWKTLEVALTNVNRQKLGLHPVEDVYGKII